MYQPNFKEICQKVDIAIKILLKKDRFLLENGVHERSISHKLAEYLQTQFPDWNVDCEYNRKGHETKKLRRTCSTDDKIYPDIIIHQRSTKENLLVIEIKSSDLSEECDIEKLKLFTSNTEFEYTYGIFIRFTGTKKPELHWYAKGQEKFVDDLG